jgi:large subunit ribosomal protein L21
MYAIVDIAGQQFKVEKDQKIYVNRLDAEEGSKIDFDQVLLIDDDGKVQVGTPVIKNTIVTASIVSHPKGDKVKIFKKKRRKGYQKSSGHRQSLTEILIESIGEGTARAVTARKAEAAPVAKKESVKKAKAQPKAKPAAEKEAMKEVKKPAAKKPAAETKKPAAAKKPAVKKAAAAKKPAAKPAEKSAPKTKKADNKKSK